MFLMTESYAIARYELAADLLPPNWQRIALCVPDWQKEKVEELRLRVGHPMTILVSGSEQRVGGEKQTVTVQDLAQLCDIVTGYSRYTATDTIAQGYLTAPGGFRIGLCGTGVIHKGECCNIRYFSSAVIRIAKEQIGISDPVLSQLMIDDRYQSTLIIAPPGAGKTTILRDLVRNLSNGMGEYRPHRVALIDERSEIAGTYQGVPQLSIGCHTDVLDGIPKAMGIFMALRTLNPQVIALDEIAGQEDFHAIAQASNCGVKLLATIHGESLSELERKEIYSTLLRLQIFRFAVLITCEEERRTYHVEKLF